jgi:uncharacterized protein
MTDPSRISNEVARRFLLGTQGMWPGRRWAGKKGTDQAIRQLEAVQVDPMTVVARSQDLVLFSRVTNYHPDFLDALLYRDRAFFDYGGNARIYPMEELPYWRLHMRRRCSDKRVAAFCADHAAAVNAVREAIQARGPLGSKDFDGEAVASNYRARTDTGLALYNLWLTGELMTHSRNGSQRLYDLQEKVAPIALQHEVEVDRAEYFFARKALAISGIQTFREWSGTFAGFIHRKVSKAEAREWLNRLFKVGQVASVEIEGQPDTYYLPADSVPILDELARGETPKEWQPLDLSTDDEVVFLSPLDNLLRRERTLRLFGFEYLWEVYKPATKRRWGYYTMPILWNDRLVGRLDPKLDRAAATLIINGFWLENSVMVDDIAFARALARGLERFARFHEARGVRLTGVTPTALRAYLTKEVTLG